MGIGLTNPTASLHVYSNSTQPTVRIVQAGAGNAITIEDATNDASPFIVDSTGSVGIGKTTVSTGLKLDVSGSTSITKNDDSGNNVFNLNNLYDYSTLGRAHRFINFASRCSGSNLVINRKITNGGQDQDATNFNQWVSDVLLEKNTSNILQSNIINTKGWKWANYDGSSYNDLAVLMASGSTSGYLGLGTDTPQYQLSLTLDSAAKPSTNTWTISSDERLKENIEEANYDTCYNVIKNLPLKRYTWKDNAYTVKQVNDRSKLGWIAQDVEAVFPKAVNIIPFSGSGDFYLEDCKSLNADQIYAAMYGTIKKLITENENLKLESESLKSELQAIKTHLGI